MEALEPENVTSQPLGPVDKEMSKSCAMRPVLEVYPCCPSQVLRKAWMQCSCDICLRRTREEDRIKLIFPGLNYTLVFWQIQDNRGNQLVCLHS